MSGQFLLQPLNIGIVEMSGQFLLQPLNIGTVETSGKFLLHSFYSRERTSQEVWLAPEPLWKGQRRGNSLLVSELFKTRAVIRLFL
jgi:hypothetical protein